jgi:hypothetical protein
MGMCISHDVMFIIVMLRLSGIGSMGIYDRTALVCWQVKRYQPIA